MPKIIRFLTFVSGVFAWNSIGKCPFSYFLSYNNVKTLEVWYKRRKQIKVFSFFPVTPSHHLSINQLRVTGAYFSCHTPVTLLLPCDGNVIGEQPCCHA